MFCKLARFLKSIDMQTFRSFSFGSERLPASSSLNTSPALRGFWWYGISVSVQFRQPGQYKKKLGADYEQLLRAVFSCFGGQKMFLIFL